MRFLQRIATLALMTVLITGLWLSPFAVLPSVRAEDPPPTDNTRQTTLDVHYTGYDWWLVQWNGNQVMCRFTVEHEGYPTEDEIKTWCGADLLKGWKNTPTCSVGEDCVGLYLFMVNTHEEVKTVDVELPLSSAWLTFSGCSPDSPRNACDALPNLVISGEEPLPNEMVISIQGTINGEPFTCSGSECVLPLQPTTEQGQQIEFWADSSFGDSSPHYSALVRVLPWGDFMSPDGDGSGTPLYYLDILSSQWRGAPLASCSEVWQVMPDVGGPPTWLSSPEGPEKLYSAVNLFFLAGMMIRSGLVDASMCQDGGLQTKTSASMCGMRAAYDAVMEWQNRFDVEIFNVAAETGIPAQLLKNVFARESQFWPGIYSTYKEAGLGQLTEQGADALLLWNPDFYSQFCPLVLHQTRCDLGFGNISNEEQAILRGALVRKVNASCPNCPEGIDISQASFSIKVFAEGLQANCIQVAQVIDNVTGRSPNEVSSYIDLWRFTLANYNAGPGCLTNAIRETNNAGLPLTWENVSSKLEPACQAAIRYVDDITQAAATPVPTPTSWVYPGQAPAGIIPSYISTPTPTPAPSTSEGSSATPTPVRTPTPGGGYPSAGTATPQPGGSNYP